MFSFFRKPHPKVTPEPLGVPSLDSVTFGTTELKFTLQQGNQKVWHSTLGDGMGLYFFDKPPDIPSNLKSVDEFREWHLSALQGTAAKLVEVGIMKVGGSTAARMIIKYPQKPHGMTYVGSFTFPFQDFSYVFKAQCEERGMTGMREAVLLDKHLAEGKVTVGDGGIEGEWNPDDEQYDSTFPQHPLSRLRQLLTHFETTCVVDPAVASQPKFLLP